MSEVPELLTASPPPPSPARTRPPERAPLRLAAVQERWHPDPEEHLEALAAAIRMAAAEGAHRLPAGADAVAVLCDHAGRAAGGRGRAGGPGVRSDGSRTRKLHIPVTAGYYEDHYFRPGPADGDPFPLARLPFGDDAARLGCPTCWDQWFPELARAYSLEGAEVLIYPTAIGSEPGQRRGAGRSSPGG